MDPGLGKTSCVLSAFWLLRRHEHVERIVVVAPLRPVYAVWPAEIEKWGFPFTVSILHGPKKMDAFDPNAEVWCVNYDGLRWFFTEVARRKIDLSKTWLVLDESTKVKHTNTQRFRTLKPWLPRFARRTILTGTPAPNGLMDLFGQVYTVDLGMRLGRFITHYRNRWFYPSGYGGYTWVPMPNADAEIREQLGDVCLRFSDEELGLPPYDPVTRNVILPPKVMTLYHELERDFIIALRDGVVTAVNAAVLSSKLRQLANGGLYDVDHNVQHVHDQKAEAVRDLLEEMSGNPLLVAYEFAHDMERLKRVIGDVPHVGGGVSGKESLALLSRFNAGKEPVILCQSSAVAHGLNLQEACHTVCWHSLTWNLEDYIQLIKRVHRQGQKRHVTVHHVVAKNTIDERVIEVLAKKNQTQQALLSGLRRHYL